MSHTKGTGRSDHQNPSGLNLGEEMLAELNAQLQRERTRCRDLERALAASEARYRKLMSFTDDLIALVDRNYVYEWVNDAVLRLYRKTYEAVIGHSAAELLGRDHFENEVKPRFDRCLAGERVQIDEWVDKPNVGLRFMQIRLTPSMGEEGRVEGCIIHIRDNTDRRRAEEALERNARQLKLITDALPALIAYIDDQQRYVFVNAGYTRLSGKGRDCFIGRPVVEAVGPDIYAQICGYLERALAGREVSCRYSFEHETHGRLYFEGIYVPHRDENGKVLGVYSLVRDITHHRLIEAELERRGRILSAVASLSRLFLTTDRWTEIMGDALGQLGMAAGVSRAYLVEHSLTSDGRPLCTQSFDWCSEDLSADLAGHRTLEFDWYAEGLGTSYETLCRGDTVTCGQSTYSEAEGRFFVPLGIKSTLLVPLFVDAAFSGFLGFDDCREERVWSLAEVSALQSAAGVIGAAIEKAEIGRRLVERERRYALATEAGKVGVWEWNLRTGTVFVDPVLQRIMERDCGDDGTEMDCWLDCIHPQDQAITADIRRQLELGELTEVDRLLRVRARGGGIRALCFRGSLIRDLHGDPLKIFGTAIDLTEQRRVEEDLRRANEEWSKTFDTVPDPILIQDLQGRLLKVNRACAERLDASIEGLLSDLHRAFPDETDGCDGEQISSIQGGRTCVAEIEENGQGRLLRVTTSPLFDHEGLLCGRIHVIHDITDRQRAERDRLAHLERQRDVLVREVHHRIKNHLQGLMGLLSLGGVNHADCAGIIGEAIAQVQSIATVYGLQSREMGADVCFREMFDAIVSNVRGFSPVPIRMVAGSEIDSELCIVRDKAVVLALVINELLMNAVKCSTSGSDQDSVELTLRDDQGRLVLTIANSGVLPPGFDFETGQGLGTGLGLLRDMLPRQGASLSISGGVGRVMATAIIEPPLLVRRHRFS
ncbi:PAS domain-containing protein [Thiorhodococcus fuscus]|uniref:PAS domain-containing protein n=1 Tax=Thiorhodococcus fuscus TaxID=527200 RepID=A0ABW4YC98_9GAMM